jgi:hypothetical protein
VRNVAATAPVPAIALLDIRKNGAVDGHAALLLKIAEVAVTQPVTIEPVASHTSAKKVASA